MMKKNHFKVTLSLYIIFLFCFLKSHWDPVITQIALSIPVTLEHLLAVFPSLYSRQIKTSHRGLTSLLFPDLMSVQIIFWGFRCFQWKWVRNRFYTEIQQSKGLGCELVFITVNNMQIISHSDTVSKKSLLLEVSNMTH